MLRAVIFDFDGLILDTELPEYTAWCEVYSSHGHSLPLELWQAAVGTRDGFDPYGHLSTLIGREIDRAETRVVLSARGHELIEALEPLAGVVERLDEARLLGLAIGLASSSEREWLEPHLDRLALLQHFDAITCAATNGLPAKPDPAVYLETLAVLGVEPDEALALEDSFNGIQAARAAGIRCVAVPNEVTRGMDFSTAHICLGSLQELSLADVAQLFI